VSGPQKPVTFTRPDPSEFALLVTKVGRGTSTLLGTEHFKPPGCDWATDRDLRDAGYVSLADAKKAVRRVLMLVGPTSPGASEAAREALGILGVEP
jgi:hypothetical protein